MPGAARRHTAEMQALVASALETPGDLDAALRRAAFERARAPAAAAGAGVVPPDLAPLVDKIGRYAWKVTDEDLGALLESGYSEDALFELVVAVAVGSGVGRLERALAAVSLSGGE